MASRPMPRCWITEAIEFLTSRNVSVGISLDAPTARIADRTRKNWDGKGTFKQVTAAMERLKGYESWSVICTISGANLRAPDWVDIFLSRAGSANMPRQRSSLHACTIARLETRRYGSSQGIFLSALDRTYELYRQTGRRLPGREFCQYPACHHCPGRPSADVPHLALRWRAVLLCVGPQ